MAENGYYTSLGLGAYRASEYHVAVLPKAWKRDGTVRGVIFCHGAGQDGRAAVGYDSGAGTFTTQSQRALVAGIAAAGLPVLAVDAGGAGTWGNDTGIAAITDAKTYLQGTLGAKTGSVLLLGVSMGGLNCLTWARANLASVAAFAGIMPVSDLTDIHANNRGGNTAAINTAYGGTYVDSTQRATHNPAFFAATGLAGLHYKAWYGASDTIVIPSTVTGVAAAIGATASTVSLAGQNHGETLVGTAPVADVVAFLQANAA